MDNLDILEINVINYQSEEKTKRELEIKEKLKQIKSILPEENKSCTLSHQ
jgi:hypothetical protein